MGPNTKVEHYMRNETAETCTIDGESPVVEEKFHRQVHLFGQLAPE